HRRMSDHVRFAPKSGHWLSVSGCPLCAKSGHCSASIDVRYSPGSRGGDVTAAVAPIGLFLVRIANFINGELWGRPTDIPWAMVFPHGGPIPRHPSQLYEAALEGVILLIVVALLVRFGALKRPGVITGVFALGYGAARIACEFFREPDAQLGFL